MTTMSPNNAAALYELEFLYQQNRKMLAAMNKSNQQQPSCIINQSRRIDFQNQGSPILPLATHKNTTMSRPHIDMCYPVQKPMRLPTSIATTHQPTSPIIPSALSLQRRDSVKSDSSQGSIVESARYKTELCRPFEETGHCRYGSKCQFAHGMQELRGLNRHPKYKTELCRTFHTTGFCSYGQRCNFIHNDEERRGSSSSSSSSAPDHHLQQQQSRAQRPRALVLPPTMPTSTGESPASSVNGDSPSQSPGYLNDDVFAAFRQSPTPSFGSDCGSLASNSSFPSPPATPRHDIYEQNQHMPSPLDLGLTIPLFSRLSL